MDGKLISGISLQTYRSVMRGEVNLDFHCHGCADIGCPETESTRLSETANISSYVFVYEFIY